MKISTNPILKAFWWMLLALSSFTLMAVAAKELTASLGTAQILFYRSLIGLLLIIMIAALSGVQTLKTQSLKKHIFRNAAHFVGQYGWFYGIAFIPLAEVFALEFTVPIWTGLFAAVLLNEAITKTRLFSMVLGLVGVFIILQPSVAIIHPAALVVLISAMGYGVAHTLTRSIVQHDSPLAIIFYMCLIQLPIALLLSLDNWTMPEGVMWLWLLLVAVTALTAHYCMSKALKLADAMVVMPMDFLRLPIIMLVGLYVYNENIEWLLLVGAAIMLLGNYVNLSSEHSREKATAKR